MPAAGQTIQHVRSLGGRAPSIFAHFFDIHFLKERGVAHFLSAARGEMRLAVRFSLLLSDEVLVPAASYYESELCRSVLAEYDPALFSDQIFLVGSGSSLEEFAEEKLNQYTREEHQWHAYKGVSDAVRLPWRTRLRSSTRDIAADWLRRVERDGLEGIRRSSLDVIPRDIERRMLELSERLGTLAFIVPNVTRVLFDTEDVTLTTENGLHGLINRAYFQSYIKELGSSVVQDLSFLGSPEPVPSGDAANDVHFLALSRACRDTRVYADILETPPARLLELRHDERFVAAAAAVGGPDPVAEARMRFSAVSDKRRLIGYQGTGVNVEQKCLVLVVTALKEEQAAMRAVFDRALPAGAPGDGNIYTVGHLERADRPTRQVLLVGASDMGKVNAATLTANALRSFPEIEHILVVGIAGGCPNPGAPEEHVRLGDIVVSNEKGIFEYDDIKLVEGATERRGNREKPSHAMLQAFGLLESAKQLGERPWEQHFDTALTRLTESEHNYARPPDETDILYSGDQAIPHPQDDRRRKGQPRVHGGGIGSADILLKDSALRDELSRNYGIKAAEMEASGVQGAAWSAGRDILVIRGISDYCDKHKADQWRYYAALTAASYARALIEVLPDEWFK
jgi:nucleoside phosphorylase